MPYDARVNEAKHAWVVSWRTANGQEQDIGRAFRHRASAEAEAATLRNYLPAVDIKVELLPDIEVGKVWPRFVQMVGRQVAPGVVRVERGEGEPVDVFISVETVLDRAFAQFDNGDDSDLSALPEALHPYRLGLAVLAEELDREVGELPEGIRTLRL